MLQIRRLQKVIRTHQFQCSSAVPHESPYVPVLDANFIATYKSIPPPFGFNGLGELVYLRTYAR
jgi:hypothetical protein